jgi:hypothetical protein
LIAAQAENHSGKTKTIRRYFGACISPKGRYNLRKEHPNLPDCEPMPTACKHPRVRIVSRHDDVEFVECLECGEVFDSEEFHDMAIEETADQKEELSSDE